MRKIILLLSVVLASCGPSEVAVPEPAPYHDASTQFIVKDIQLLEGMKSMTSYYVEVVDVNDLSSASGNSSENLKFWFCDSVGKYRLGQPIHFDKQR
jgi:hypothetical protein